MDAHVKDLSFHNWASDYKPVIRNPYKAQFLFI